MQFSSNTYKEQSMSQTDPKWLPIATALTAGIVKIGTGISVSVDGTIDVSTVRGKELLTNIFSSAAVLTLNTWYNINCHLLTEDTTLAVPVTSGWADGDVSRIDLFVKIDAAGSYELAFHPDWQFDGGVEPDLSTAAGAVDHLVATVIKSSTVGTVAVIGLAAAAIA